MLRQKYTNYVLLVVCLTLYLVIAYGVSRHETLPLLACYFSLFFLYTWIVLRKEATDFWFMGAVLFRAALLFSVPALSDDFYRFIWDGRLIAAGYHPFAEVPEYYLNNQLYIPGIVPELFEKLNSKQTFTVYPPVAQFIFWLSVKIAPHSVYGSILTMKLVLFSFELGTLFLIRNLLSHFTLPAFKILFYALNPLVILELTGNLHFEGVMMFFLLLAIWLLTRHKYLLSSIFYALSISTKLLPLLFLPACAGHLGWKTGNRYWITTAAVTALLFVPLVTHDFIFGFAESLGYYFSRFEFNASIYYLVRAAGYYIFGFNIIYIAGWVLGGLSTLLILTVSYRRTRIKMMDNIDPSLFITMLWCLLIYFAFATTVHPWYIVSLIIISVFTPYRFPVVWSGLIFLTYGGYSASSYNEMLPVITMEYMVVTGYLLYETVWTRRLNHS